jgi:hypothetical protein
MMCLGWNNKSTCKARPDEQVVPPSEFSFDCAGNMLNGPTTCDTSWFWWAAAGILATAALVGQSGGGRGGQ